MSVDPVDRPNPPSPVERRQPSPDEVNLAGVAEQKAKAEADVQRLATTIQDSRYTGRGSLVDELA